MGAAAGLHVAAAEREKLPEIDQQLAAMTRRALPGFEPPMSADLGRQVAGSGRNDLSAVWSTPRAAANLADGAHKLNQ
jgi:hypothetical protein